VLVMSPMEFKPVTAQDIAARAQRAAGPAVPPAAGQPLDYALSPDRAWAPSPERIRLEVRRLTFRLQDLRARPMLVRETDRDRTELFAMGMLDAVFGGAHAWALSQARLRTRNWPSLIPASVRAGSGRSRASQVAT
jgi:hypothetical protein